MGRMKATRLRRRGVLDLGISTLPVALSLLVGGGVVTASEDPFRLLPNEGGRVELPDLGFALTFPDDWTAYEVLPAGETVLAEDPLPDGQTIALVSFSADEDSMCQVILDDPMVRGEPSHLASYSHAFESDMTEMGMVGVTREQIDLQVGPSWRLTGSWDGFPVANYLVRGRKGLYTLYCFDTSGHPPEDLWLPIASSFRFFPDPATDELPPSLVRHGGRIAYPEWGFAVTFPVDWTVEQVDPATSRWLKRLVAPQEGALRRTLLWADAPGADGACRVTDITRDVEAVGETSVEGVTASLILGMKRHPAVVSSDSEIVGLPVGQVGHATATHFQGEIYDDYYFGDAGRWLRLRCETQERPADRWLSIAETFEFLPAEE